MQVILTAVLLSLICKSPDLDEDDEIAEDEEDFALKQDQEWLIDPETAGIHMHRSVYQRLVTVTHNLQK